MSDLSCKFDDSEDVEEENDPEEDDTSDPENLYWEKCTTQGSHPQAGWKCIADSKVICWYIKDQDISCPDWVAAAEHYKLETNCKYCPTPVIKNCTKQDNEICTECAEGFVLKNNNCELKQVKDCGKYKVLSIEGECAKIVKNCEDGQTS